MNTYQKVVEEIRANAEQWRAFDSNWHCVTLAGPGSGKTKVLTAKMARLLREKIRHPRGIACVTYNNECVRELERRLAALGLVDAPNTFIGTLHAFCLRFVIAPFARFIDTSVPQPVAVASDRLQRRLLDQAIKQIGVYGQEFESEFVEFRRTAIDRIDGVDGWRVGDRGLTDVCLAYESLLRAHGHIDFDDIVLIAARIVERSSPVRRCLQARFPALLVDEYQDLGVSLHRIVMSLCLQAGVRLFAVGDPDQSIYGFIGARPSLLRDLAERSDVEKVELRLNYRSGRNIVAASELALGERRGYVAHKVEAGRVEFVHRPGGLDDQVQYVCSTLIPDILGRGESHGQIAVLYPTRQEGAALESGLAETSLPFARIDAGDSYRRTPFVRLVEDLAAWCCGGWREGSPSTSALLTRWNRTLAPLREAHMMTVRRALVRFMFSHRDYSDSCREWLLALDSEVIRPHVVGQHALGEDELEAFEGLLGATANHGPLNDLDLKTLAGKSGSAAQISLMNLHTAKGTEFNVVIIIGLDNGRLPSHRARTPSQVAEQRRLLFVGISRARREVYLLYSGWTKKQVRQKIRRWPQSISPRVAGKVSACEVTWMKRCISCAAQPGERPPFRTAVSRTV